MMLYSFGIDLLVWGDIGWLVSLHRKLGRRHERMEWQCSSYNKKKAVSGNLEGVVEF